MYHQELDRLEAQESLVAAQRAAMGAGSFAKEDARAVHQAWQRRADPESSSRVKLATAEDAAALGIGVVTLS